MAACRSTIEWKLPRRMRLRVSTEKKVSTAFSHEPEVGVKWKVQRGSVQPCLDLRMLVRGVDAQRRCSGSNPQHRRKGFVGARHDL